MSNYQHKPNPQSHFKSPYKTQRPELQEAFDTRPPLCAVWITPEKENRLDGRLFADVTLVRDDGLCFGTSVAINPDTDVMFDHEAAEELVDYFRSLTGDRYLLFYNAVEGLDYLKYYVGPGKRVVCLKEGLAESFPEFADDRRKTTSFDEAMNRLGIPNIEAPWPEVSNCIRLLSACYKCVEATLDKYIPPSYQ